MTNTYREEPAVRLYAGAAPGSEGWTHTEQENRDNAWQTRVVFNVTNPTLTPVLPAAGRGNGAAAVICPGGGFHALSIDSEGLGVARWLSARGVACFVLKYRLVESKTSDPVRELEAKLDDLEKLDAEARPVIALAAADGCAAVGYVRAQARRYGVDPRRVGIIGFSAGGTVAASVAFQYTQETRPDFVAPIYLQYEWALKGAVRTDAPPLFVLAATDDPLGLAPHSVRLYQDWTQAGKSAELHVYSRGGHGFGMRRQNLPSDRWIQLFADWLEAQGLTRPEDTALDGTR